jgi:hypothetical protein
MTGHPELVEGCNVYYETLNKLYQKSNNDTSLVFSLYFETIVLAIFWLKKEPGRNSRPARINSEMLDIHILHRLDEQEVYHRPVAKNDKGVRNPT